VPLGLTDLVVKGPGPVPDDLRQQILADTTVMKAAALLWMPPLWLVWLLSLYAGSPNRLQANTKRQLPRPALKNIAAAVAVEIGISTLAWESILHGVEDAARVWNAYRGVKRRLASVLRHNDSVDWIRISEKSTTFGSLVNKGASGGAAEIGTHASYQEVAMLTDVRLALRARRSGY
jgi:hypothetical protein